MAGGRVASDGALRLSFDNGATIVVPPSPAYEAWQVAGPGDYLVVCAPEGSLAVWDEDDPVGDWDTPEFWSMLERLRLGDAKTVEPALVFLEADPWTFRSGYAKEHVARALARHRLDPPQQARIARICLHAVDVGNRWEFRWYCRLANRIDPAVLREDLTGRLDAEDLGVARRAVWMLARLRHPQLTDGQLAAARSVVLRLAAPATVTPWSRSLRNLAVRFWSPEWEAQLLTLARSDPDARPAALRVLRSLPRLHLPDADARVAAIGAAVIRDGERPGQDWSQVLDQASALADPGGLIDAVTPLLTSTDPQTRRRAEIALIILNGDRNNG